MIPVAIFFPHSPLEKNNSGVARLEMFDHLPEVAFDRFHFGESASANDYSIGPYYAEGNPRVALSFWRLYRVFARQYRRRRYQVIWVTLPPIAMALFAVIIGQWFNIPVVVDVRDPGISSVVIKYPRSNWRFRFAHYLEKKIYRSAARICVTTAELIDVLTREFGIAAAKCLVVSNATNIVQTKPPRQPHRPVKVIFTGTFSAYQVVEEVIASIVAHQSDQRTYCFDFYGFLPERAPDFARWLASQKLPRNIVIHGPVARAEAFRQINQSDIAIVPIAMRQHVDLYEYAIPLKLYEALAFSRPIVLFGGTRASVNFVRQHRAGVHCPLDGNIMTKLQKIVDRYSLYAARAGRVTISRKDEAVKLMAVFRQLARRRSQKVLKS